METELIQLSVWEQLTQEAMKYISKTPTVALIIFATWFLSRIAVRIVVGAGRIAKTDPAVVLLITSSIRFVAWIFGFTAIFNALGLTQIALTLGGTVALVAMSPHRPEHDSAGPLAASFSSPTRIHGRPRDQDGRAGGDAEAGFHPQDENRR